MEATQTNSTKPASIGELMKLAEANNGKCTTCHQTINVYRYKANGVLADVLIQMAERVKSTGINKVNFDDIPGAYKYKSQRTKMRLHGLIARYKENGEHIANTWLITRKGWAWLAGQGIDQTVVVYNNTLLGHEGGTIRISDVKTGFLPYTDTPNTIDKTALTIGEAHAYGGIRSTGRATQTMQAKYMGDYGYIRGQVYTIVVDRLQPRRPINVITVGDEPADLSYKDVAKFSKQWQIV